METIRSLVEDWMVKHLRTQNDLAMILGIAPGTLTRKIEGDLSFNSIEIIVMADNFDEDPSYLAELAGIMLEDPHKMNLLVGVTGPSGSGKSWLCMQIKEKLESRSISATHLRADVFYREDSAVEQLEFNYDNPKSLNTSELLFASRMLKDGHKVPIPGGYDYSGTHNKIDMMIGRPSKMVMVDGHLLLTDQDMVNMLDLIVYVGAKDSVCLERRIKRDMEERGRTQEQVEQQYADEVRPAYKKFVLPMRKRYADRIEDVTNEDPQDSAATDRMINDLVDRILATTPSQRWPYDLACRT